MQLDKKAVAGDLKFILPEKIGTVKIQGGLSPTDIRRLLGNDLSAFSPETLNRKSEIGPYIRKSTIFISFWI
jgi:hypothetical protein